MIFLAEPPIDFESQIKRPTGFPPPLLLVIEFFMLWWRASSPPWFPLQSIATENCNDSKHYKTVGFKLIQNEESFGLLVDALSAAVLKQIPAYPQIVPIWLVQDQGALKASFIIYCCLIKYIIAFTTIVKVVWITFRSYLDALFKSVQLSYISIINSPGSCDHYGHHLFTCDFIELLSADLSSF